MFPPGQTDDDDDFISNSTNPLNSANRKAKAKTNPIWKRFKVKAPTTRFAILVMAGKILFMLVCSGILFILIPCVLGKACPSFDYMFPVKGNEPVKKGSNSDNTKLGSKGGTSGIGSTSTNEIHEDGGDRKSAHNNNQEVSVTMKTETTTPPVIVSSTVIINSTETGEASSSTEVSTSDNHETHLFPFTVTVYAAPFHNGRLKSITFENAECKALPTFMQRNVHSIDTEGNCVYLCASTDCSEKCMKFAPGTVAHDRIMSLRFHNKAVAAMACKPELEKAKV